MKYTEHLSAAMELLAQNSNVLFLGQAVKYKGTGLTQTFAKVPIAKLIEMPVCEELQLGMTLGLTFKGYIPISVYPRWNFLLLATNQLVNHIDKWAELIGHPPHLMIRVSVGSIHPLNPGPQHRADCTEAFKILCPNIKFYELTKKDMIMKAYQEALLTPEPSILVEYADKYND
jgi:pyruvate/2-oxoglutarate/acetoin dehydrogenase E1 component